MAKHLALLAEAGLVTSDAGQGRRVLYRHRSEPMRVAQSYLAALAADWDEQARPAGGAPRARAALTVCTVRPALGARCPSSWPDRPRNDTLER